MPVSPFDLIRLLHAMAAEEGDKIVRTDRQELANRLGCGDDSDIIDALNVLRHSGEITLYAEGTGALNITLLR